MFDEPEAGPIIIVIDEGIPCIWICIGSLVCIICVRLDLPVTRLSREGRRPRGSAKFCVPGEPGCDSYDASPWAGTSLIQIKSVTFADGSTAQTWAAVSDFGGKAG